MLKSIKRESVKEVAFQPQNKFIFLNELVFGCICTELTENDVSRLSQCSKDFKKLLLLKKLYLRDMRYMQGIGNFSPINYFFDQLHSDIDMVEKRRHFQYFCKYFFDTKIFENKLKEINENLANLLLFFCDVESIVYSEKTMIKKINFISKKLIIYKNEDMYIGLILKYLVCKQYEYKTIGYFLEIFNESMKNVERLCSLDQYKYTLPYQFVLHLIANKEIVLHKYQQMSIFNLTKLIIEGSFDWGMDIVAYFVSYKFLYIELNECLLKLLNHYLSEEEAGDFKNKAEILYYIIILKNYDNEMLFKLIQLQNLFEKDDHWVFRIIEGYLKNRKDLNKQQQRILLNVLIKFSSNNLNDTKAIVSSLFLNKNSISRSVRKESKGFLKNKLN